jgi:PEP-CTERM motif
LEEKMSSIVLPFVIILAFVVMNPAPVAASIIRINDLVEGQITVTVDGTPITVEHLPNTTEAIRFTFSSTANSAVTANFSIDLIEGRPDEPDSATGVVSDRLFISLTSGNPDIIVRFASDPNVAALPQSPNPFTEVHENGDFQDLLFFVRIAPDGNANLTDQRPTGPMASILLVDTFQVGSDVPEPPTLLLLLLGIAACGLWRIGRREVVLRR